jgi:hypothetical protein
MNLLDKQKPSGKRRLQKLRDRRKPSGKRRLHDSRNRKLNPQVSQTLSGIQPYLPMSIKLVKVLSTREPK